MMYVVYFVCQRSVVETFQRFVKIVLYKPIMTNIFLFFFVNRVESKRFLRGFVRNKMPFDNSEKQISDSFYSCIHVET